MKRRWLSTMVALTALAAPAGAMASGGTFHNPLFQTDSPDPWIQFMDGRYFMSFTTQNDIELRSDSLLPRRSTESGSNTIRPLAGTT